MPHVDHKNVKSRFCPDCGKEVTKPVIRIDTRRQLLDVAEILGVRGDWHEPDEQKVTAAWEGWSFDNAGFWPEDQCSEGILNSQSSEMCVKLFKENRLIAVVNLATLFAMACRSIP